MEVINTIKHLVADRDKEPLGKKRSPHWPAVRKKHLEQFPNCAVCGGTDGCEVHHIKEFHNYPELELEPTNLITLCEANKTFSHHLHIGHLGNYKVNNPNVVEDATYISGMLAQKSELMKIENDRKIEEIVETPKVIYEVNTNVTDGTTEGT